MRKIIATLAIAALAWGSATAVTSARRDSVSPKTAEAVMAGDAAMTANAYETAISAYTTALEAEDLRGDMLGAVLLNRGIAYIALKQCPAAIEDFTRSIAVSKSERPSTYAARGQCYMEGGKAAEGIADLKQAVAVAPTEPTFAGALCSNAFNAKIYVESGPACEAYSAFVPTDPQIIEASAVSYQNAGDKVKALAMWNKLLALDPASTVAKQGIQQNT